MALDKYLYTPKVKVSGSFIDALFPISSIDRLQTVLNNKQASITSSSKLSADLIDDTSSTNKFITASEKAQITTNQTNISTINTTLSGYGDIVTHNVSEFATPSDIPTTLAELTEDTTHRVVTDTEKATWNAKQSALPTTSTAGQVLKSTATEGTTEWGSVDAPSNMVTTDTAQTITGEKTIDGSNKLYFRNANNYIDSEGSTTNITLAGQYEAALKTTTNNAMVKLMVHDGNKSFSPKATGYDLGDKLNSSLFWRSLYLSGNLSDGTNEITIAQIYGKQDAITSSNKLSASLVDGLSDVATSGSYNDLLNLPTIPSVINNVTSTSTTDALSANMGKDLQDQITNLKQRGRYLSVWNATTGLAETTPTTDPYTYKAGDYFIVGTVGATNYKPTGTQYSASTPSSTVETNTIQANDTYYYDGTSWTLLQNAQVSVTFASIAGSPSDNSNLASALNAKQDAGNYATLDTSQHFTNNKYFDNNSYLYFGTNGQGGCIYGDNYNLYIQNPYAQSITFQLGSVNRYAMNINNFVPKDTNTRSLGSTSLKWKDLYLSGNLSDGTNSISVADIVAKQDTIPNYLKNASVSGDTLTITKEDDSTVTFTGGSGGTSVTTGGVAQSTWETDTKQDVITSSAKLSSDLVDDSSATNKFVTSSEKTTWSGKQDAISDLATIRSGASAGATALQSGDNISELTNDAGYTTNTGTITGITMNGASKGTSGVVDLGTVITAHQSLAGKQDVDSKLTSISGLSSSSTGLIKLTNGVASLDSTTYAQASQLANYQPLDADLTAIAGLTGTSGLLKKTASNTWALDTNTYLTGITSSQVTTALGYTPYNSTNPNGYTSNTGTVTSVQVQAGTGLSSSQSTAQTGTLNTTISVASGYKLPTTTEWSNKEDTSNKVTSLSSSSTNTQYPSAKCVYDLIGNINDVLTALNTGAGV